MNRTDFHKLAEIRIREAKVLLDRKCYEGAYYLAGYAVECALKACIAKRTQEHDFPPKPEVVRDYYQHKIESLAKLAGLELELKKRASMVQFKQFHSNWNDVTKWSEQVRYETRIDSKQSRGLYRAITNSRNGVLVWLKKYW
ncbi:MAG: HEPN domain-containing protein [Pyrinomonadaceae bacterium]